MDVNIQLLESNWKDSMKVEELMRRIILASTLLKDLYAITSNVKHFVYTRRNNASSCKGKLSLMLGKSFEGL